MLLRVPVAWETDSPDVEQAERQALDAAIGGDSQAFVALYDRYVERVYRFIYYRVGNQADAEDLTQQVFLRAWKAIGRYRRTRAKFIAWLLTIAHHLVISLWQSTRAQRTWETHHLEDEIPAQGRDPEAEVFAQLDRQAVREAVLRLRPEHQLVITLRFIEHLDYADVAAALGKSEATVRVIQHRALAELRCRLAQRMVA